MQEDQLRSLFELCATRQTREMAAILVDNGQHLAALLVSEPDRHREIFAALDMQIVAGELDPAMVGMVAWAMTPNSSLQYLEPGSPIWRGVPTSACRESERAGPPPDQGVDDAWLHALHRPAKPPTGTLECFARALTHTSGLLPITVGRALNILSTDVLEYPYALTIVVIVALCYHRMPVPEPARTRCMEALARARGSPSVLILPAVII